MAVIGAALAITGCRKDDLEGILLDDTVLTDPDLTWSSTSCTAIYGSDDNSFPTLSYDGSPTITFSSSDESVATVGSDGTPDLVAAGTATITATCAGDDSYAEDSAVYTLTVQTGDPGLEWTSGGTSYNDASWYVDISSASLAYPSLTKPSSVSVTYSSSNTAVATISSSGAITLVSEGETTITATSTATSQYSAESASYKLVVEAEGSTLISPELVWDADIFTACLADDSGSISWPTLDNPYGVTVTYSSSTTSVATINSSTGAITLVGDGTTTITATSEATDTYKSGTDYYKLTVTKGTVTLSWSASAATAYTDAEYTLPTLTVDPSSLASSVTYSSGTTSVATIGSTSGAVTIAGTGTTTITATVAETDVYYAASASYTLKVTSSTDTGSGTFVYKATGAANSEDDISGTTFERMVTVVFSSSGATVEGLGSDISSTISGNDVTLTNSGTEKVVYVLSGTASDGFFKLYSDNKKQAIVLDNVSITNKNGAAINNQSGKRTFVMLKGTNKLADGSSYSDTPSTEDEKAALFSEGQLIISPYTGLSDGSDSASSGSLTVTATGKSGITSDDYIRFTASPTVTVTSSAGHGIRGQDGIYIESGNIGVTTSANMKKGLNSDEFVEIDGGTVTVKVTGGTAYDSDDKEYKSTACIKADNYFLMKGGTVTLTNTGDGGKGIRCGSDDSTTSITTSEISGGTLTVTTSGGHHSSGDKSPKGIKEGYESGSSAYGKLFISGGTVKVSTSGAYGEGIESKNTLEFSGGYVDVYSAQDDAINAGGSITFSGGYVYAYAKNNDAIDSNYGKSGAINITDGVVIAHGTKSPEEGLDCDNNSYIIFKGGTVFTSGGMQGQSSSSPTCSQPVYYLQNYSLTSGYFTVTDSSSKVIMAVKVPASLSGCYSFITSSSMSSGTTYKYGVTSSTPSSPTTSWSGYYYAGGSASVSTGSWTAGSGYSSSSSSGSSGGNQGGNPGGGPGGPGGPGGH